MKIDADDKNKKKATVDQSTPVVQNLHEKGDESDRDEAGEGKEAEAKEGMEAPSQSTDTSPEGCAEVVDLYPDDQDGAISQLVELRSGLKRDEYLAGYDDGMDKANHDARWDKQGIHYTYAAVGIVLFVFLGVLKIIDWGVEETQAVYVRRCADLCEPYRVESCAHKARTATCRTVEGYVVRVEQ